jgi:hypothetical protein
LEWDNHVRLSHFAPSPIADHVFSPITLGECAVSAALFRKWRQWLDQIYRDQLHDLLVSQHIFRQFEECTAPYIGRGTANELVQWIDRNYLASATTAIRRIVEEPLPKPAERRCPKCGNPLHLPNVKIRQQRLSLIVLLRDLANHADLLTIEHYRATSRGLVAIRFANRDFMRITKRQNATEMPVGQINRDIVALRQTAEQLQMLETTVVADTEPEQRLHSQTIHRWLNEAIALITNTYQTW